MTTGATGDFTLKPWELHGEGKEFESISSDFTRAATDLEHNMAGLGEPWGRDRPGAGFGMEYDQARDEILAGLHALGGKLGNIGTGLHTMADSVHKADDDAKQSITAVERNYDSTGGGSAPGARLV